MKLKRKMNFFLDIIELLDNSRVIIIKPKAIVCQDANIVGEVTIDEGTVVHPRCNILAENGPIVIGKNNIIDEQVTIKNVEDKVLTIGNNNLIEVGACE